MQECNICGSKLPHDEAFGDSMDNCLKALVKRIERLENLHPSYVTQTRSIQYKLTAIDNIYQGQIVSWDLATLKAFVTVGNEKFNQIGMAARNINKDETFIYCPSLNTDAIQVLVKMLFKSGEENAEKV